MDGNENNWQCPYCGSFQVLQVGKNFGTLVLKKDYNLISISKYGTIGVQLLNIACLNCKELSFSVNLNKTKITSYDHFNNSTDFKLTSLIKSWSLMPDSRAKPQPDYSPRHVVADYEEACKIADLSPRASAILARRCLEGMIKDFCKIKGLKILAEMIDQVQKSC